jgi:Uncharacterized vancomycin resistance protein
MSNWFTKYSIPAFLIIISTACSNGGLKNHTSSLNTTSTATSNNTNAGINYTVKPESLVQEQAATSGEATAVPWENDERFIISKSKNGTDVLMAAYRTVLRDPLPGEEYNVHFAARKLAGTIVQPNQVFSQNREIGPYTIEKGYQIGPTYIGNKLTKTIGGGVCKIASTLYNVAILGNMPIVERYYHNMPVPYVPYGQDATVSYGDKDLRFRNSYSFPILIWAQGVENVLYIGFYGKEKPPKVQWHHEKLQVFKATKVYKDNLNLPAGTEKQVIEGMDGAVVKSWITIKNSDGTTRELKLGNSYYSPLPYVIERN